MKFRIGGLVAIFAFASVIWARLSPKDQTFDPYSVAPMRVSRIYSLSACQMAGRADAIIETTGGTVGQAQFIEFPSVDRKYLMTKLPMRVSQVLKGNGIAPGTAELYLHGGIDPSGETFAGRIGPSISRRCIWFLDYLDGKYVPFSEGALCEVTDGGFVNEGEYTGGVSSVDLGTEIARGIHAGPAACGPSRSQLAYEADVGQRARPANVGGSGEDAGVGFGTDAGAD